MFTNYANYIESITDDIMNIPEGISFYQTMVYLSVRNDSGLVDLFSEWLASYIELLEKNRKNWLGL